MCFSPFCLMAALPRTYAGLHDVGNHLHLIRAVLLQPLLDDGGDALHIIGDVIGAAGTSNRSRMGLRICCFRSPYRAWACMLTGFRNAAPSDHLHGKAHPQAEGQGHQDAEAGSEDVGRTLCLPVQLSQSDGLGGILGAYSLAMASAKILSVFIVIFSSHDRFSAAADMIIEDVRPKENDTFGPLCRFQPMMDFSLSGETQTPSISLPKSPSLFSVWFPFDAQQFDEILKQRCVHRLKHQPLSIMVSLRFVINPLNFL